MKREQGCSEAAASDVVVPTEGNVAHSTLLYPINLDQPSPTHHSSNKDDVPLSRVYENL